MKKQSASIYCNSYANLKACEEYAQKIHKQFLIPIVESIIAEEKNLKINYLPSAEIEDTDIFDSQVIGFRDGWQCATETQSA